ncbi:type III-B CRISPR module RAMP protein Cmr4 [Paenibacillus sp. GSMTC-2017]|uniref:type III-B CRISPR module RAMP protein Cmr4 n=1 Tax=Paenibacillus sp. GSMTC-2017 TaxID=2794350 RepID=UPI0018D6B56E|nr:type III-B CRISPR module RAMP protein Cmr4 [Paenibacillus sp. GSMTC-2017]MBH5320421.1 type III-B CRISPR module RAMP protein Cmr4 [Paenibacillus sp. GSMTC-2017]
MSDNRMFYIHCLSPVHVGTGQGVGIIDLPIMRERVTSWPLVPGSSIKGVLREFSTINAIDKRQEDIIHAAFGKVASSNEESSSAGSLAFTDARLLAFPVVSQHGTFAYVSCPLALRRLLRDVSAASLSIDGISMGLVDQWETILNEGNNGSKALVGEDATSVLVIDKKVSIDEFEFVAAGHVDFGKAIASLAKLIFADDSSRKLFCERFMLASDDAFNYFATLCCEIVPRIKIQQETKTVDGGALWYEEYLPTESILYGIAWSDKIHIKGTAIKGADLFEPFQSTMQLQIGGNATVGKGRVSCRFTKGDDV